MGEFKPTFPAASEPQEPVMEVSSPEQKEREALKLRVVEKLSNIRSGMEVSDADGLLGELSEMDSDSIRLSPEVQAAAKKGLTQAFQDGRTAVVLDIVRDFKVAKEFLGSPEITVMARQSALRAIRSGSLSAMRALARNFDISSEFLHEPETIEAARTGVEALLGKDKVRQDQVDALKAEFGL